MFMLVIQNDGCRDMQKKCGAKNLCLSSEAITQEVFCANDTTRNSVVELK